MVNSYIMVSRESLMSNHSHQGHTTIAYYCTEITRRFFLIALEIRRSLCGLKVSEDFCDA